MRRLCLALVMFAMGSGPAHAQTSVEDVLSFLLTNQAVETGDLVRDRQAAQATADTLSRFLLIEMSRLPISSSSGGFNYRFNPALGTVERRSDTFGPFFLERAVTIGRGQGSLGTTIRHSRFSSLDGRRLRNGTLVTVANRFRDEREPFDIERLTLRVDASTFTVFGTYGVTDRFDVGASIPVVRLTLSGERQNVYRGTGVLQARGTSAVTGVADVGLRAKYVVVDAGAVGVAADADLRLPTGSEEDLLGVGRAALRLALNASYEEQRVAVHARAGVARGGVTNEVEAGGAVVAAVSPRVSVVAEVIGRRLSALSRLGITTAPHPISAGVDTARLVPLDEGTTTIAAIGGVKWNVAGTWLLSASVLVPLTEAGLTARITPALSLDVLLDQ